MKKRRFLTTIVAMAVAFALLATETAILPFKGVQAEEQEETVVSVTTSAINKAKANISLYFGDAVLPSKGFLAKGKVNGVKEKILYVPLEQFAQLAMATVTQKGKTYKVTAMNVTVKFKRGKNGYTFEDGMIIDTLYFGKSYLKDDILYVPIDVIKKAMNLAGFDLEGEVVKKKYQCQLVPIVPEIPDGPIVGGYELPESADIPAELLAKFAGLEVPGYKVTPVALVGTQVVAGMNYKILCRVKAEQIPDAAEVYAFATIYADLEGNVSVTDFQPTEVETNIVEGEGLAGGWSQPESVAFTDTYKTYFDKATEQLDGVSYTPVAVLATQVVAGMNVCVLCESQVVYPGAPKQFSFVYVYVNFTGDVEITNIVTVENA